MVFFSEPIPTPYSWSSTPGVLKLSLLEHAATGVLTRVSDLRDWEDAGGPYLPTSEEFVSLKGKRNLRTFSQLQMNELGSSACITWWCTLSLYRTCRMMLISAMKNYQQP